MPDEPRKPQREILIDGRLTGTIDEETGQAFGKFDPIQQTWRVNPVDEAESHGTVGDKDA
ncbi:MAG: hypothetical protein C0P64_003205 [Bacillota bacterium]